MLKLLGLLTLFLCASSNATTYYVSSPNNTSVDTANRSLLPVGSTIFNTIQLAADYSGLLPGDIIEVMNGTYNSNPSYWNNAVVVVNKGGTVGALIQFINYPNHHPIVTTVGNSKVLNGFEIHAPFVMIKGFEVIGKVQTVTLAQATATFNTEETAWTTNGVVPGDADTNGNCIFINLTHHVTISNNIAHDCPGSGIATEKSDYISYVHNIVYNCAWWSPYDTSGIGMHRSLNVDTYTGYHNMIVGNISYNNGNALPYYNFNYGAGLPTDGNGITIDSNTVSNDGKPYVGRTLIEGNIAYFNGGSGIQAVLSNHVDFINNTAYMNNTCPIVGADCGNLNEGQIFGSQSSDINIYNNIMYAPTGKYAYTSWKNTIIYESNNSLYHSDSSVLAKTVVPNASDITLDPQFKKTTLLTTSNVTNIAATQALKLLKTSPARGIGVVTANGVTAKAMGYDGNTDTTGTGIDLGALSQP